MTVKTLPLKTGAYLYGTDSDDTIARDQIVLKSGSGVCLSGTVLGKITATGKYTPINFGASDGSQHFAGILYAETDATAADRKAVATVRLQEVVAERLIWPAGATNVQTAGALVEAAAVYVIAR